MKIATVPKKALKRLLCVCGVVILYFFSVFLFFGTPKSSYWLDDAIYGKTRYFHFKLHQDQWQQSLPIDPPQAAEASYRLAIVEFDEFGDFFQSQVDRSRPEDYQLNCAKEMLRSASEVEQKPVLLFLFVHGWRHNASPDDENLVGFKKLLSYMAQSDWGTNQFAVCGVYVGWRGATIRPAGVLTKPSEYLSFWSRKSVAEKIASTPASAALFSLTEVARNVGPDPSRNPSRIVLAGHSLGAGILMNSVSQALAYEYARAERAGTSVATLESPANLILLLNPAFESVYLRELRVSIQPHEWKGYPWLVSLTSETDVATKYIFPFTQTFRFSSNARKSPYHEVDWSHYQRGISATSAAPVDITQRIYVKNTPGHNRYMRDLHLVARPSTAEQLATLQKNHADTNDVIGYGFRYGHQNYFLLKGERGSSSYGYFDTTRPTNEVHPLFWVATVDRTIIDGHSLPFDEGIRRDNFLATIMTLISDSRVQHPTEAPSKVPLRPTRRVPDLRPPRLSAAFGDGHFSQEDKRVHTK